ncbi:hypothetical protein GAH_00445 [Geoglobus ahangari]|uniref:Uncharacterized protein n=1 Tax=Geoglobus ahangari TaxID=113653 RepID=A0A0F7IG74_9EURY|nr:hypothetical protein [Geoglobus ahangari]AKG92203.1 hypothetical protein GAH_00445 [Geoglobus ahangari]
MESLRSSFAVLLESFEFSSDVEERIRLLRAAVGKLENIFYGTEKEDVYRDVLRRLKLRLKELRAQMGSFNLDFEEWRVLMDTLDEMRDEVERIAVKEAVVEK